MLFATERYVVLCLGFPSFLYTIILTLMHTSDSDDKVVHCNNSCMHMQQEF